MTKETVDMILFAIGRGEAEELNELTLLDGKVTFYETANHHFYYWQRYDNGDDVFFGRILEDALVKMISFLNDAP